MTWVSDDIAEPLQDGGSNFGAEEDETGDLSSPAVEVLPQDLEASQVNAGAPKGENDCEQ